MIWYDLHVILQKVITVYLNLHKVSSLQIKKKKCLIKWTRQEVNKKPDGLINKNPRHFAFSKVFFRSESKFKTPATSETDLHGDIIH